MSSLRFRLPLIFLAGVLLASAVAGLLAVRLLQDYARRPDRGRPASPGCRAREPLQRPGPAGCRRRPPGPAIRATSSRERHRHSALLRGRSDLPRTGLGTPSAAARASSTARPSTRARCRRSSSRRRGRTDRYLAVAQPIEFGGSTFGALVVAKPTADLRERWGVLLGRLGLALLAGLGIAALLFLYLSRRITKPVLALSAATDRVAEGRYDVKLPRSRRGRRDRAPHRPLPGDGRAPGRGRGARAPVPDDGLA